MNNDRLIKAKSVVAQACSWGQEVAELRFRNFINTSTAESAEQFVMRAVRLQGFIMAHAKPGSFATPWLLELIEGISAAVAFVEGDDEALSFVA